MISLLLDTLVGIIFLTSWLGAIIFMAFSIVFVDEKSLRGKVKTSFILHVLCEIIFTSIILFYR